MDAQRQETPRLRLLGKVYVTAVSQLVATMLQHEESDFDTGLTDRERISRMVTYWLPIMRWRGTDTLLIGYDT